jgi:hypothetical protein
MTAPRPTPFDLVFDVMARDRFPEIRTSLESHSSDPANRDAFLLDRHVVQVLRDIVPDEGVGEAVDQHVALLHNAYLFWQAGQRIVRLSRDETESLLARPTANGNGKTFPTSYVQFPERTLWAQINEGAPHEPLDGVFVTPAGEEIRVLGIFGMHPDRIGFSVAEVSGPRKNLDRRADGTSLFAPLLPGGAAANLYSVDGASELVELGARAAEVVRKTAGES